MNKKEKFANNLKSLIGDGDIRPFARRCGVTETSIRNYLKGAEPRLSILEKLADAGGVSVSWLVGETDDPNPPRKIGEAYAATHELGVAYKLGPKIGDAAGSRTGEDSEKEGAAEESFSLADMITMTTDVLKSQTVYRSALASNIRAFHQAVIMEGEMENVRQELREMREKHAADMDELKIMIASLGGTSEKKLLAS